LVKYSKKGKERKEKTR